MQPLLLGGAATCHGLAEGSSDLEGCPIRRNFTGLVPWTKSSLHSSASDASHLIKTVWGSDLNQAWSWILLSHRLAILSLTFFIQNDATLCQYLVKTECIIFPLNMSYSPGHIRYVFFTVMADSLQPHGLTFSPPGSSVHGILQARILEWVAIPLSETSSQPRDRTWISCIGRESL